MIAFEISGIRVCFHFSFFATVALLMLLQDMRYTAYGLYACMVHECGHLMLMQLLGVKTGRLLFYAAGIKLSIKDRRILPIQRELPILLGGCAINFITFGFFFAVSGNNTEMQIFAYVNLIIGLFNLLPVKGFDGGRISELLIEHVFPLEMIPMAKLVFKGFCILVLTLFLIYFLVQKNYNISLYLTLLYFLVTSMLF